MDLCLPALPEWLLFKNTVVAAVSLACFGVFASDAKAGFIRCDTCRVSADFRAQAVAAGPGIHMVYNVAQGTDEQYYVGPDAHDRLAGDAAVSATGGAVVDHAGSAEHVHGGTRFKVERIGPRAPTYIVPFAELGLLPSQASSTAADYMRDHNLQGMVASAVGDDAFVMRTVGSGRLDPSPDPAMPQGSGKDRASQPWMNFKIVFIDGSQVTLAIDLAHADGKTVANSARGADGQPLPDEA